LFYLFVLRGFKILPGNAHDDPGRAISTLSGVSCRNSRLNFSQAVCRVAETLDRRDLPPIASKNRHQALLLNSEYYVANRAKF
jgi:hypothetical protein